MSQISGSSIPGLTATTDERDTMDLSDEWTLLTKDDESQSQSDIDVLDGDDGIDDEDRMSGSVDESCSVISHLSSLNLRKDLLLPRRASVEEIHDDLSDISHITSRDELNSDVELRPGVQVYVHTPNRRVNFVLNLVMALSITAVVGFAIGNFIGWSSKWTREKQLTFNQIMKLKQLQDELVLCLQKEGGDNTNVCRADTDYWKAKFDQLFNDNVGLKELLEKTQQQFWSKGHSNDLDITKECGSGTASTEYNKLKLDLLVNQMEHLKVLQTFQEVQLQEKQSKAKLKRLEMANIDLKTKLIEEEEDDKVIVESMELKMNELRSENEELKNRLENETTSDFLTELENKGMLLEHENRELKLAIKQLDIQMDLAGVSEESGRDVDLANLDSEIISVQVDSLKQRINHLVAENDDLKSIIARDRWANHADEFSSEEQDPDTEYESPTEVDIQAFIDEVDHLTKLLSQEKQESNKWKELYESTHQQKYKSNKINNAEYWKQCTEWIINLTEMMKEKITGGARLALNTMGDVLNSIIKQASESDLTEEIYMKINATQTIILDFYTDLSRKWEQLQTYDTAVGHPSQKVTSKLGQLIEISLRKVQEAGDKFVNAEKPLDLRISKFQTKIAKIVDNLNEKWMNAIEKLNTIKYEKGSKYDERAELLKNSKNTNEFQDTEDENWIFERAKYRESERWTNSNENWYLKRNKKWRSNHDSYSHEEKKSKDS